MPLDTFRPRLLGRCDPVDEDHADERPPRGSYLVRYASFVEVMVVKLARSANMIAFYKCDYISQSMCDTAQVIFMIFIEYIYSIGTSWHLPS